VIHARFRSVLWSNGRAVAARAVPPIALAVRVVQNTEDPSVLQEDHKEVR
jgi:hypothetical protein